MKKHVIKQKLVVGVTGGFGTGKSVLARSIAGRQGELIDADEIAHQLLLPKTAEYKKIVQEFGAGIVNADGNINRAALADTVFKNSALLACLNQIIHPGVIKQIKRKIHRSTRPLIVLDAPLLFEAKITGLVDYIVVVDCSGASQIKRLHKRNGAGFSVLKMRQRIRCQMPQRVKKAGADFIIDNNRSLYELRKQGTRIRRLLWKSLISAA